MPTIQPQNKTIGYIRVSTDKQDLDKQRHLLFEYAHNNGLNIDAFITVEMSSRKNTKERKIDKLMSTLLQDDVLLVAELSRLGRNMLETLNIINALVQKGIKIIFVRQPELSTNGPHGKLLLAIYSYFAEAERDFISIRTKQGLAAARAKGVKLGRPKGSRNKERKLDRFRDEIQQYQELGLPMSSILKIINRGLEEPVSYNSLRYFCLVQSKID